LTHLRAAALLGLAGPSALLALSLLRAPALPLAATLEIGLADPLLIGSEPPDQPPVKEKPGSLEVRSEPAGAEVWLDGKHVGAAPVYVRKLAPGRHALSVMYPAYVTFEEKVKIAGGKETKILAVLQPKPGRLEVTTYPQGGEIWVDGKIVGKTRWSGMVEAGEHDIVVNRAGFMPGRETATMPPDGRATVDVVLMQGTTVSVPHGDEETIRRTDRLFDWPRKGEYEAKDRAPMVLVPAGDFLMGSPASDVHVYAIEKPAHTVFLAAFYIDRFEVPNALYRRFLDDVEKNGHRACDRGEPQTKDHTPGTLGFWGTEWNGARQPVMEVDWWDAAAYCAWAGKRLPTEAEWEKAARGADGRTYPWGKEPPGAFQQGNFYDRSGLYRNPEWTWIVPGYEDRYAWTAPVGSYPRGASPYGAEDMAGNVTEWVKDWFSERYYDESPRENPKGPLAGKYRVLRGGSWNDTVWGLRVTDRLHFFPGYRVRFVGFRCAKDAE